MRKLYVAQQYNYILINYLNIPVLYPFIVLSKIRNTSNIKKEGNHLDGLAPYLKTMRAI